MTEVRPDAYKQWTPQAQERAFNQLQQATRAEWRPFYCRRDQCDGLPHGEWKWPHARWDQHPPKGDWLTWLIRGGRGSGKTRSGSEWVHRRTKVSGRIALVAPTGPMGREVMVEGESGLLATAPPGQMPSWEPSKSRLTWPNGARATVFSAEEPDRLRGPQHHDAWLDEPAHMPLIEDVWSNLMFGMRLGKKPRICCTTTPIPSPWLKALMADEATISVVVSTYANISNLPPHYAKDILKRYEGTRLGRQEIYGEVLADVEGALWNYDMIEAHRIDPDDLPELDRVVVGIDPAGSANARSDETGIIIVGVADTDYYVLGDKSGKYKPGVWADRAVAALEQYEADVIVAERNYGGDMVRTTLENADRHARIVDVESRRGKVIRADPIVALYERGKVHHVGPLNDLEDQLVSWVPGDKSPDRLDALVHAVTHLAKVAEPAAVASPRDLGRRMDDRRLRLVRNTA